MAILFKVHDAYTIAETLLHAVARLACKVWPSAPCLLLSSMLQNWVVRLGPDPCE